MRVSVCLMCLPVIPETLVPKLALHVSESYMVNSNTKVLGSICESRPQPRNYMLLYFEQATNSKGLEPKISETRNVKILNFIKFIGRT